MQERRKESRSKSYLGGLIVLNRESTLECLIRNASPSGAMLDIPSTRAVPGKFGLSVPRKRNDYHAQVRWRRAGKLGVALLPQPRKAAAGDARREIFEPY